MKILQINTFSNGSTGKIAREYAKKFEMQGDTCYVAFARGPVPNDVKYYKIGNSIDVRIHGVLSRITDKSGFYSKLVTKKFLKWIDDYKPDVVYLHNLHGYYINIELLFEYLANNKIMIYWTLHDCWSFTGHCAYFDYVKCDKWEKHCDKCPQKNSYPKSLFFDNCYNNFERKKKIFNLPDEDKMIIITPSQWLADLVSKSFLNKYKIEVRHNTIDFNVFKPTNSNFKEKMGIADKKIILGVANKWEKRKGIEYFYDLDKKIDHNKYLIILVGVDKNQLKYIEKSTKIIGMCRTNSQKELVEIYSASDVLFNPTLEENYPTVNLEAQACSTKVLTFDTGGCKETDMGNLFITSKETYFFDLMNNI